MTQSNRILLAVVLAAVATAAFWFLAYSPKRDEVAKADKEVAAKRDELDRVRSDLANYAKAKAGYQTSYASVVRLGKAVPADDDVRSLVVQLDKAASETGVDFRTIDVGKGGAPTTVAPAATSPNASALASATATASLPPGASVGPAGFPTLPFNFSFRGSFFRLSDFFSRLESFVDAKNNQIAVTGRLLTVDSVTLEPDSVLGFPHIRASVGATSFLVNPAEGLTGGASPTGPGQAAAAPGGSAPAGTQGPASTTATSTGGLR